MEINKEREDFEAEFSKIKSDIAFWLHTWDEEMQGYNHPVMCWFWYMWRAATAQAVPDGFVLVPKEPTNAMLFAASGRDIVAEHYGDENIMWPELRETWKAMLEAQEPAND